MKKYRCKKCGRFLLEQKENGEIEIKNSKSISRKINDFVIKCRCGVKNAIKI
jgi:phage FluMu protein Com|nr:MAG TPA: protein of unknown function (DUF3797) [Caudoviricetes sp.]